MGETPKFSSLIIETTISPIFLLNIASVSLKLSSKLFLIGKYELINGIERPTKIPKIILKVLKKKGITRAEYQLNKNATKLFAMYAVVKPNIVPGTAKINP